MASGGEQAVTQQPRSKRRELEDFVRDLDPLQVQGQLTARWCLNRQKEGEVGLRDEPARVDSAAFYSPAIFLPGLFALLLGL